MDSVNDLLREIMCYHIVSLRKSDNLVARVVSGTAAEIIMIAGYYASESVLYKAMASLANIPANAVQGVVGVFAIYFYLLLNLLITFNLVNSSRSFSSKALEIVVVRSSYIGIVIF